MVLPPIKQLTVKSKDEEAVNKAGREMQEVGVLLVLNECPGKQKDESWLSSSQMRFGSAPALSV